jgi:hypothetical protein
MLDEVLGRAGQEVEIEDIIGQASILPMLNTMLEKPVKLNEVDSKAGSLPSVIKAAAARQKIELPDGWKASVAIKLVSEWAEKRIALPDSVLNQAETLFKIIEERFSPSIPV